MIISIVIEYTNSGNGKRIFITRANGLTRDYPYTAKNLWSLMSGTPTWAWDTRYFTNSLHITRH